MFRLTDKGSKYFKFNFNLDWLVRCGFLFVIFDLITDRITGGTITSYVFAGTIALFYLAWELGYIVLDISFTKENEHD